MKEKVFEGADVGYLTTVAEELGIDINIPADIRTVQRLKDSGVPVPGDLDPQEAYLLLEITKRVMEIGVVPKNFTVYLNDRMEADMPEGVPGAVKRKKKTAFKNLVKIADEIISNIDEQHTETSF